MRKQHHQPLDLQMIQVSFLFIYSFLKQVSDDRQACRIESLNNKALENCSTSYQKQLRWEKYQDPFNWSKYQLSLARFISYELGHLLSHLHFGWCQPAICPNPFEIFYLVFNNSTRVLIQNQRWAQSLTVMIALNLYLT